MSQVNILLNKIITNAIKRDASYLHLEVGAKPVIRVDGQLFNLEDEQVMSQEFIDQVIGLILPKPDQQQLADLRSVMTVHTFEGDLRFKVHVYYQKQSPAILFSRIPGTIKSPNEMQLTEPFIDLVNKQKGLVVVAGLHSSGKSATVAALLNYINYTQKKYILTLEKPIEYILNSQKSIIEQRQLGRDAADFAEAVKFANQGDVDIVFLSQLDSYELLNAVINLVDSGRLVIVVMEASSAPEVIEKLVNLSPAAEAGKTREILADMLLGVAVQRLLSRRGGGQIIASEILITNSAVASLIREGKFSQTASVIQTSREEGMRTLDQSLTELVRTEEVAYEDALALATDKIDFKAAAQK